MNIQGNANSAFVFSSSFMLSFHFFPELVSDDNLSIVSENVPGNSKK